VAMGNGVGGFSSLVSLGTSADFQHSVSASDLDLDGHLDVALTGKTFAGDGTGSFVPRDDFEVGEDPWCVTSFDVDGDAMPDLAVANANSNAVSIVENLGSGQFSGASFFDVQAYPLFVTSGDFNEDGSSDLAVANTHSDSISLLLNRTAQQTPCRAGN